MRTITVALLLVALARPTLAQDQVLEQAKHHFDEGQNLYLQGKYAEAVKQFQAAYELKKYPAFLFNIAVCFEKNRNFPKALDHYERYLRDDPHSQDRALVLKRIKAIKKHLNPPLKPGETKPSTRPSKLPPDLPPVKTKGLVVIETKPEGAAIYLGDKKKGIFTRTPYTGSLPPGRQTVIIELKRYRTERKTFQVRTDRMVYLYFSLSLERNRGWIEVKANIPAASVYVDTKDVGSVGTTPYTGWLRPGKHKIIVERDGYQTYTREVSVTAGDVHVVNAKLEKVTFGWLKVTGKTTQNATVKVDGKPVSCAEYPCRTQLSQGSHKVVLEREGYKNYEHQVDISQATETQLAVRLNPKPSRLKAYISFGVSAALLTGGIVAGVMSRNRKNDLESDLDSGRIFDSSDSRITEGKITSIVANSLFGLSGLVGALGIYYLFRNEGPDSFGETRMNKIAVQPTLGPDLAGLTGKVRF
jgi:hypothetical protein